MWSLNCLAFESIAVMISGCVFAHVFCIQCNIVSFDSYIQFCKLKFVRYFHLPQRLRHEWLDSWCQDSNWQSKSGNTGTKTNPVCYNSMLLSPHFVQEQLAYVSSLRITGSPTMRQWQWKVWPRLCPIWRCSLGRRMPILVPWSVIYLSDKYIITRNHHISSSVDLYFCFVCSTCFLSFFFLLWPCCWL